MARRHLEAWLSYQESSVPVIWSWYRFQRELIDAEEKRALVDDVSGELISPAKYQTLSRNNIIDLFAAQRVELSYAIMLQMLAATEAAIRVDFVQRIASKRRDAISREFARIYKEHKLRASLEEQILAAHRENSTPEARRAIGDFVGALKLRHWLAHGRYWKPKFGQQPTPETIFTICNDPIIALGLE